MEEEEYDEFPTEKEIGAIVADLKKRPFKVLIKNIAPRGLGIWSWRCYSDGSHPIFWGKSYLHTFPGKSFEDVEAEEHQIVLFAGKFYICDGEEGANRVEKPKLIDESFRAQQDVDEKAIEEAEEWLILN